jgi:uncharacterized protein YkwD
LGKRQINDLLLNQLPFRQDILKAHNFYRALHCAPPLTLDNSLSEWAQSYANHLVEIGKLEHSDREHIGENLYMSKSSRVYQTANGETKDAIQCFHY